MTKRVPNENWKYSSDKHGETWALDHVAGIIQVHKHVRSKTCAFICQSNTNVQIRAYQDTKFKNPKDSLMDAEDWAGILYLGIRYAHNHTDKIDGIID